MTSSSQSRSTILDLAFRSYLQDALHASENKLRTIVEHSVDGVVVVDDEGHIIMWSRGQERITGISASDVLNCLIWDVQYSLTPTRHRNGSTLERLQTRFLSAIHPENSAEWSASLEIEIESTPGKRQIVQQFTFAIPTPDGLRVGYVFRDVTEERQKTQHLLRRNAELTLLNRVNRILASSLDTLQVHKTVLREVIQLLDALGASIWWVNESDKSLVCIQSLARDGNPVPDAVLSAWSSITDTVYHHSEIFTSADALRQGWLSRTSETEGFPTARSLIGIPIQFKGNVLGVLLVVDEHIGRFNPTDINLLEPIAGMAALAFENAQLHVKAQKLAALQERQRLAMSLHDAINQSLLSAGLIAEALPRLIEEDPQRAGHSVQDMRRLLRDAVADLRAVLSEMQTEFAHSTSFNDTLRDLATGYSGRTGTMVAINLATTVRFNGSSHHCLYRLCSEVFANIIKHAEATQVWVSLTRKGDSVEVVIRDNGIGFDASQIPTGHYGLNMIRQQAATIGGRIHIVSEIGRGTEVRIRVPLSNEAGNHTVGRGRQ